MTTKKTPKPKAKRGRPPIDNPANLRVNFRVTPEERARYHKAASAVGLGLTTWVKQLLDSVAPPR